MVNFYSQNTDVKNGDRVSYQGKEYSVVSTDKWFTLLEDDNGNIVRVNLKNSAFDECKAYCQKRIDEYRTTYELRSESAKQNLTNYYKQSALAHNFKQQANKLLKNGPLDTLSKSQQNEYHLAMENYKIQNNLADDSEFAWKLDNEAAFNSTFSARRWVNQLSLANAMENSIFGC